MPMCIKNLYTCPKCGHPVEEWGWHKWRAGGIFGRHWPCKNCGALLEVNPRQRLILNLLLLVCAALLYFLLRSPLTPFLAGLFVVASITFCDLLASIFLFPIVEKSATEYTLRVMKSISECPKCGYLVGLRHRGNTLFYRTWPCKNCGTLLGFRYWKSAIFIFLVAVLFGLWMSSAPHIRLLTSILSALNVLYLGMMLANIFFTPVVEKGTRQKSDSD